MNILGIETSCDETAASIVCNGRRILSNIVSSSLNEHKKYGGIVPEIASRRQMELINSVVKKALSEGKLTLKDIDGIAVTVSPGLIGSLLVGLSFARALSFALKRPLVEVNHIQAHLYANFLVSADNRQNKNTTLPRLPAVGLVVSGGHSSLFYLKNFSDCQRLGATLDDAAGETFDKVARMLNLGYPGGPMIDRLAATGKNNRVNFSCAQIPESADFSFSGIKTAVWYYLRDHWDKKKVSVNMVAYAFQKSVVSVLVKKSLALCQKKNVKTLLVGGGVAANSALRDSLWRAAREQNIKVFFPPLTLCLDNAAMIAGLGYHFLKINAHQRKEGGN